MAGRISAARGLLALLLALVAALAVAPGAAADTLDQDSDGYSDEVEEAAGTDPADPEDYPALDSDGDGFSDEYEDDMGTDPEDASDHPEVDSDGDGFSDEYEDDKDTDPNDAGDKPKMKKVVEEEESWFTALSVTTILTFAVFIIAAGGFTVYFGAGKSRRIGGGLLGLGIAILAVGYWIRTMSDEQTLLGFLTWDISVFRLIVTVAGALVGFAGALVLFLIAIMKS